MIKLYLALFFLVAAAWLGLTAYVILNRLRHDRRVHSLDTVLARLGHNQPVMLTAKDRSRMAYPMITQLPQPVVYRVAADMASNRPVSEVFAEHAVERWGIADLFASASEVRPGRDRWQRIAALCILTQTRAECIHQLLSDALEDRDSDVVGTAVVLLGRLKDAQAARLLVLALRTRRHLPSFIARQLDTFRIPIDDLLAPLLDAQDPELRYWGVMLMARDRGDGPRVAQIARLAEDPDPAVRKAVVQSLGMLGASREALIVLQLLYDEVAFVRVHAVRTLAGFHRPEFAESIKAMLTDPEWRVRHAAREALLAMQRGPALPDTLPLTGAAALRDERLRVPAGPGPDGRPPW